MGQHFKIVSIELEAIGAPPSPPPPPSSPPPSPPPPPGGQKPPFLYSGGSVTGNDFPFNEATDESAFEELVFDGFMPFEMPDKRPLNPKPALVQDAYVFVCSFKDGTFMQIALDKAFGSEAVARADAERYTTRLGILPLLYRSKIKHMVVHKGGDDTTAFAEDQGNFFVIYSGNATKRLQTNDLEDTFFHEGSHASIQEDYLDSAAWKNAVAADGAHITEYAKSNAQEDFAESALFAYVLTKWPERFPATDRAKIEAQIPNRLAFFRNLFASGVA